jgi:GNAT superfamily N-acetyltransferase
MRLRSADPAEAEAITALMRRSKAHWGYDQEFMDRAQDALTVRPDMIRDDRVVVAERDGVLLGFYQLCGEPPAGRLEDLFVDPAAIGTGLGRVLIEHAFAAAGRRGFRTLEWESDPNAEPFYRHLGAERVGEREVSYGRSLPVMRIAVQPPERAN